MSFAACVSFNEEQVQVWELTEGIVPMSASGIAGDYHNRSSDPNNPEPFLWAHLMMKPDTSRAGDIVRIEHIGTDRLRFLLMRGGRIIGSAEEGCARLATHVRLTKSRVGGAPPALWTFVSSAIAMGANGEGRLSVSRRTGGVVFLVVIPWGAGGIPFAVNYKRAP